MVFEKLATAVAIDRLTWVDKPGPDFDEWRYRYDPYFSDPECKHVIYNYVETDESLRDRIKKHRGVGDD